MDHLIQSFLPIDPDSTAYGLKCMMLFYFQVSGDHIWSRWSWLCKCYETHPYDVFREKLKSVFPRYSTRDIVWAEIHDTSVRNNT